MICSYLLHGFAVIRILKLCMEEPGVKSSSYMQFENENDVDDSLILQGIPKNVNKFGKEWPAPDQVISGIGNPHKLCRPSSLVLLSM